MEGESENKTTKTCGSDTKGDWRQKHHYSYNCQWLQTKLLMKFLKDQCHEMINLDVILNLIILNFSILTISMCLY